MNRVIKTKYNALEQKVNGLSVRERLILSGVLVFVVIGILDWLILQPNAKERQKMTSEVQILNNEMSDLHERIKHLSEVLKHDPNVIMKNSIEKLKQQHDLVDEKIRKEAEGMIDPEVMPFVLGELLSEKSGMSVQSIEAKAVKNISISEQKEAVSNFIFQHEIELKLKGSYFQLVTYLESIEDYPAKLIWDEMDYVVDKYPKGTLILRVSTLSLREELIRVVQ